jgi:hypothetical protein
MSEAILAALDRITSERDRLAAKVKALEAALANSRSEPKDVPRGPCGMRYHASDCNCDGTGGDR